MSTQRRDVAIQDNALAACDPLVRIHVCAAGATAGDTAGATAGATAAHMFEIGCKIQCRLPIQNVLSV